MHIYQQIRSCVAVVNFHPADCGYMVPGIAIRLGLFVKMLDEHEISHKSLELIRHEIRLCKSRSKQYFVREELLEIGTDVNRRSLLVCKGCAVLPRTEVPPIFFDMFAKIEDEGTRKHIQLCYDEIASTVI